MTANGSACSLAPRERERVRIADQRQVDVSCDESGKRGAREAIDDEVHVRGVGRHVREQLGKGGELEVIEGGNAEGPA